MQSHRMIAACALGLLALVAMGGARAQLPVQDPTHASVTLTLTPPAAPLPAHADVLVPYVAEYNVGPNAGGLRVDLYVANADVGWLTMLEPASHVTPSSPSAGGVHRFEGMLRLRHDGTPIAFEARPVTILAMAQGDDRLVRPADVEATIAVMADYRPGLQVQTGSAGLGVPENGGDGFLYVELRNTGNGPQRVTAEAIRAPADCIVQPLMPLLIEHDRRESVTLEVVCARGWEPGPLQVSFRHAHATNAALVGEPVEPTWEMAHGHGGFGVGTLFGDAPRDTRYDASWGATLLVPAALLLAALISRRR